LGKSPHFLQKHPIFIASNEFEKGLRARSQAKIASKDREQDRKQGSRAEIAINDRKQFND
jgi:hypothetical protein